MNNRFRLVFTILLSAASISINAAITDVVVTREDNQSVRISWSSSEPVTIVASDSPDLKNTQTLATELHASEVVLVIPTTMARPYFELRTEGHKVRAAERLLPLEGGRNFRDLGGYTTTDGKNVRWGRLFRSGKMDELTVNDYRYLSNLGIQVVCDLRSNEERAAEPTDWQTEPQARYRSWQYAAEDDASGSFRSLFTSGVPAADTVREFMMKGYPDIALSQAERYEAIFDELAAGEIPLAFNCSAGKDRAGLAAALILTALGVERDQIVHDYSLSETFVDYIAEYTQAGEKATGEEENPYAFLSQLPVETLEPLFRSDPAYLEYTFNHIEAEYGSVMAFIREELAVTDQELASIRSYLLE